MALALTPAVLRGFVQCEGFLDQLARQHRMLRGHGQPERGSRTCLAGADAERAVQCSAGLELHASGRDRTRERLRETREEQPPGFEPGLTQRDALLARALQLLARRVRIPEEQRQDTRGQLHGDPVAIE